MSICSDTNTCIAFAALSVSVFAIGLSLYEGHQFRKHNILSVKPHLSFAWNKHNNKIDVHIKNNGLGSAIIKSFNVSFDKGRTTHSRFEDAVKTVDFTHKYITHFSLYKDESIAHGQSQTLLDVEFADVSEKIQSNLFSKLIIEIVYESMYGEKSSITLKDDIIIMSKIEPQFNLNEYLDGLRNSKSERCGDERRQKTQKT